MSVDSDEEPQPIPPPPLSQAKGIKPPATKLRVSLTSLMWLMGFLINFVQS